MKSKAIPLHALHDNTIFRFWNDTTAHRFLYLHGNTACYISTNRQLVFTTNVYKLTEPLF